MTIRSRLLLGLGLGLLVAAALLGLATAHLHRLAGAGGTLVRDNVRSVLYAARMADALAAMDRAVVLRLAAADAVVSGAADSRAAGPGAPAGPHAVAFDAAEAAFARHLADERRNLTVPGEGAAADRAAAAAAAFARAARGASTLDAYHARVAPALGEARVAADRIRDLNLVSMRASADAARATGERAFWTVLLVGLAALAVGAGGALALTATVVSPLARATDAARRIGAGDLDVALDETAPRELADLARTMNAMTQRLRDVRDVNVADLRAEKNKADAILHALDDGVVVVDEALRVVAFNPAARRVLGPGLRLALPLSLSRHGARLDAYVRRASAPVPARPSPVQPSTTPNGPGPTPGAAHEEPLFLTAAPEGDEAEAATYQAVVTAVRGPFGPSAVVVLFHDVTAVRDLERMKSSFIMAASHELRTPLTGLEMSLGLLARSSDVSDRDRDLVAVAAAESARLSGLVSDLLHLARAEAGHVRLVPEALHLGDVLADLHTRFAAHALGQGLRLRVDAAAAPAPVWADAESLERVLSNLVTNALRYATGEVNVVARDVGSDVAEIRVEDDGPGVPEGDRERVFQRFVQVEDGRHGGAGVGLALVRELIALNGGLASIGESALGGAAVRVTLPLARG